MTDKYMSFANSSVGRKIVGTLGLPRPPVLDRYQTGAPLTNGRVVLGAAHGGPLLNAVISVLATASINVLTHGNAPDWIGDANRAGLMTGRFAPGTKVKALIFDASGIEDSTQLDALYHFFHDTVRSLDKCGRIIILGRPPESCTGPRYTTAQRSLEGMTRSLGKEVRRGCTTQLVYISEGAEGGIESTLRFLLSPRSAYVSAQVIRISGNAMPVAFHVCEMRLKNGNGFPRCQDIV